MLGFFELTVAQDAAAGQRSAQAENGARLAISAHILESKDVTSSRLADPLMFEAPFLAPPFVATGVTIKKDYDPSTGWLPDVTAGVWQWHRNPKGHYTGAYVFIGVKAGSYGSELQHHFIFMGTAYKDLGPAVATEAQLVGSRPVGFGGVA